MSRTLKLGVVMDPIQSIKPYKDSTLAMLLEAQLRGYELHYFEMADIWLDDGTAKGRSRILTVADDEHDWFTLSDSNEILLGSLDVILMRKDPPFDTEFIYATYILEQAEAAGALVVNKPSSLRDANEKAFTAWFPQCTPPTLISRDMQRLRGALEQHGDVILKPLDGMGGASIFRLKQGDPNVGVVLETLTEHGSRYAIAQKFIPDIKNGDKRILVIDGEPMSHCLARIPAEGETRGNIAAGGRGVVQEISARDRWIVSQVAPTLREKGLLFVGLDVIGDWLTEINVTSPTCIREIDAGAELNIAGAMFTAIENKLH